LRELLEELNQQSAEEIAELTELSERVSRAISGTWSIDWLHVPDRDRLCIDMAHAETHSAEDIRSARLKFILVVGIAPCQIQQV